MGIRDEELKRLEKYAQGLGIKVYHKPHVKGCGGAEWDMDDQSIVLYHNNKMSKTKLIIYFIHELGHHLDWVYNNRKDSKAAIKAFEFLGEGHMYGDRSDIPKKYRKVILDEEKAGGEYHETIYKELNIKIPLWKIKMEQHLDMYEYRCLYREARFTKYKEFHKYKKSITKAFKERYGK